MNEIILLRAIRKSWIQKAVQSFAKGATLRDDLREQIERFHDLVEQCIETGDYSWVDQILMEWTLSQTKTDLNGDPGNLNVFINELFQIIFQTAKENLDPDQSSNLIDYLVPTFGYTFTKVSELEIKLILANASAQLNQIEETLHRLEKSKTSFIGVAAHELKTPLTLIEGYASMMDQTVKRNNPESSDLVLTQGILSGTKRMGILINDMVDASLIDNKMLVLHLQPTWLNRIFLSLSSELKKTSLERKQNLEITEFPGFNDPIFGDPDRLLQAFRNILMNGIKFTPDNGRITVSGRCLEGFTEIVISDSGIGIDIDDQNLIFEKFSGLGDLTLHSSGKSKFKGGGAGLGLYIAKGIIDAHEGTIWLESPGFDEKSFPGTTFHILIPKKTIPQDSRYNILEPMMGSKQLK